nr:MAG TPA: hypothetical protein [Caudoviricetes sp.]
MLDTRRFRGVLKKEKALNPLRLKASEMAPPVGLEPTTLRLTVFVTRISNSIIRFHAVWNHDFPHITQLINGSRGAKNR